MLRNKYHQTCIYARCTWTIPEDSVETSVDVVLGEALHGSLHGDLLHAAALAELQLPGRRVSGEDVPELQAVRVHVRALQVLLRDLGRRPWGNRGNVVMMPGGTMETIGDPVGSPGERLYEKSLAHPEP